MNNEIVSTLKSYDMTVIKHGKYLKLADKELHLYLLFSLNLRLSAREAKP